MNERGLSNKELATVIVSLVAIGLFAANLLGWLRSSPTLRDEHQIANAKQQALALLMYAGDNDDVLPPGEKWMDAVMPYLKNKKMFKDPMLKGSGPDEYGYAFLSPLSMVKISQVEHHEDVPLTFPSIDANWNAGGDLRKYRRPLGNNKSSPVSFLNAVAIRVGSTWPETPIQVKVSSANPGGP